MLRIATAHAVAAVKLFIGFLELVPDWIHIHIRTSARAGYIRKFINSFNHNFLFSARKFEFDTIKPYYIDFPFIAFIYCDFQHDECIVVVTGKKRGIPAIK